MTDTVELAWYTSEASTFGDRVVAARESRHLSAKALARHLGVATKTVENWENDIAEPRANKLQMLSGVLNVSIPWLLTGAGEDVQADPVVSNDIGDILAEIRSLRVEMVSTAERLGLLEKRLKQVGAQ